MSFFAFIDFTSHKTECDISGRNIKENMGFVFLRQTLRSGRLPLIMETESEYYSELSECPETTAEGLWQRVDYAIGFEIKDLRHLGGFKIHQINRRQISLELDLPCPTITELNVKTHQQHLDSIWRAPTTDSGKFLKGTYVETRTLEAPWPSEVESIFLVVKQQHELEKLLSDIQFLDDKCLIEPENFKVILSEADCTKNCHYRKFAQDIACAKNHSINPWYADPTQESDEAQLENLRLVIEHTLEKHAHNDPLFNTKCEHRNFNTTHLWLLDNRHPLSRALHREGALTITDEGRYLVSIDEFNFFMPFGAEGDDEISAMHHRFALMEELASALQSKGVNCDYFHSYGETSADTTHISGAHHIFTPFEP
ncbi:DUF4427 domain-containing protein [Pseudomonas monteilii]|uniref:DUF4427 domain-containing protein n=1 Tax=Pseudomonas monteilii TaxID=76759 RepID=UPI003D029CFB